MNLFQKETWQRTPMQLLGFQYFYLFPCQGHYGQDSNAVIKTMTNSNLGRKEFISV